MKYKFNLGLGKIFLHLKLICFCNLRIMSIVGSAFHQKNLNVKGAYLYIVSPFPSAFLRQIGVKESTHFISSAFPRLPWVKTLLIWHLEEKAHKTLLD